jgi:hypothetical protein
LNDVSGSRIVVTDLGAPGPHIMLYDVATGTASPLTSGPTDQNPRIDGDIVQKNLVIAEGAHFDGRVRAAKDASELEPVLDAKTLTTTA